MFPTGVGMNRVELNGVGFNLNVPHRRGDEPEMGCFTIASNVMFPTGVGMNLVNGDASPGMFNVPHRRGDEPV